MNAPVLPRIAGRRRGLRALLAAGLAATGLQPALVRANSEIASRNLQVLRPKVARLPAIRLTTMQGSARTLDVELANVDPLVLSFVFTTCSSSCSILTALLADVQRVETERGRKLQLASITIDPDNDTPDQLRQYAKKFGIGAGWQFYTGRFDDLLQVQRHFDVYRGSKVSHPPVLLLRRQSGAPWVRIEGFPSTRELVALIDGLPAAS